MAYSLTRLENTNNFTEFVKIFTQFGGEMVDLAHRTGDRQQVKKNLTNYRIFQVALRFFKISFHFDKGFKKRKKKGADEYRKKCIRKIYNAIINRVESKIGRRETFIYL